MKTLFIFLITFLSFVPRTLNEQNPVAGFYENDVYVVLRVDPEAVNIVMYHKNSDGATIRNFTMLEDHVWSQHKRLVFACNAGMFMADYDRTPLGLYIENGKVIRKINTRTDATTNFYIQPNGVFYIMPDGTAGCKTTQDYIGCRISPEFATQSGPMLTVNGEINSKFAEHSTSHKYRNGVGINQDGDVVFVLSKVGVNFYELAYTFLHLGCDNSLFLDGDISDFYYPAEGLGWHHGYMSIYIAITK